MRLRVRIKNSKDCRIELPFPDLSVKYNNGYAPALRVAEGEEIPLDVLDPEDIRKSLKVGSLKGYLLNGWIEEIKEEQESPLIQPNFDEATLLNAKVNLLKQEVSPQTILPQQNLSDVSVVEEQPISVQQNESITDLNKVFSFDDFCKLSHFLKVRFIKESGNIDLLHEISGKTSSAQLKNNIQLRLTQLKV